MKNNKKVLLFFILCFSAVAVLGQATRGKQWKNIQQNAAPARNALTEKQMQHTPEPAKELPAQASSATGKTFAAAQPLTAGVQKAPISATQNAYNTGLGSYTMGARSGGSSGASQSAPRSGGGGGGSIIIGGGSGGGSRTQTTGKQLKDAVKDALAQIEGKDCKKPTAQELSKVHSACNFSFYSQANNLSCKSLTAAYNNKVDKYNKCIKEK